jgi:hypothetical protein
MHRTGRPFSFLINSALLFVLESNPQVLIISCNVPDSPLTVS